MPHSVRVIPRLDIKGPNLVKGIHLEGLRVLGKTWNFAYKYYLEGADELIYIDAVASLYGRNGLLEIVKKTAEKIFIPLTVGGGVRTLDDIKALLRAGADKVAINTEAVKNPELITLAAKAFGSQCIVASIQSKLIDGKYFVFTDNARESTELDVLTWAKRLVDLGAGELLITSIDQEGTGKGYDLDIISKICEEIPIPVIACGGCGKPEHVSALVKGAAIDAVCASSIFHYKYFSEIAENDNYEAEGNIEFLKSNRGSLEFMKSRLTGMAIKEVKDVLTSSGIPCRTS